MSAHVDKNPALQAWANAGLHEVTLPTLTRVKVRIPAPEALVRDGALPDDLRRMALQFAVTSVSTKDAPAETLEALLNLSQALTARCVKAVWNESTGDWVPVSLTVDELDALELPSEDITAIEAIALRRQTPNQVTARSLAAHGITPPAEVQAAAEEEAGSVVTAFGPFRGIPGRAADGADGRAVRPKSRAVPRDQRSGAGAAD